MGDWLVPAGETSWEIPISVTGGYEVDGLNFNVQIEGGLRPPDESGPVFTNVDILSETVFDGKNTGSWDNNVLDWIAWDWTETSPGATVLADGVIGFVTLSTVGCPSGTWDLVMSDTLNGPTDFSGLPISLLDGSITVNQRPIADAGDNYTVEEGASITLDGSHSMDTDPEDSIVSYRWDLDGDGIFGETGENALQGDETSSTPSFSAAGLDSSTTRTVALQVKDNNGLVSELDQVNISIKRQRDPLDVDIAMLVSVREVDSTLALTDGCISTIPENPSWLDEWTPFLVDVWVHYETSDYIEAAVSFDLSYTSDLVSLSTDGFVSGELFGPITITNLDDSSGVASVISLEAPATINNDGYALLTSILMTPTSDNMGVSLFDASGVFPGSSIFNFAITEAEVEFGGSGVAEVATLPSSKQAIIAVPYDLNDDGIVNFSDLARFARSFRQQVGDPDASGYTAAADYNQDGMVNFSDLALLARNFRRSVGDRQGSLTYAENYLPSLTSSTAAAVMFSQSEQIPPAAAIKQIEIPKTLPIKDESGETALFKDSEGYIDNKKIDSWQIDEVFSSSAVLDAMQKEDPLSNIVLSDIEPITDPESLMFAENKQLGERLADTLFASIELTLQS